MKLTTVERLLLWNQYEVRKHVDPSSAERCETVQEALQSGYQPLYELLLERMEGNEISEKQVKFVYDVLDMYDAFQRYEQASGEKIEGSLSKFAGFDGHGDLVGFTRFIIERLGRWNTLGIKDFDAHMPIEGVYGRMLEVWLAKPLPRRFSLTKDEVAEIIAAAPHPDSRRTDAQDS